MNKLGVNDVKKSFLTLMTGIFLLSNLPWSEALVREVAKKWDNVSVAADAAWTVIDKNGDPVQEIKPSMNATSGSPVYHSFLFSCPTATSLYLELKFNSISKPHNFQEGDQVGADNGSGFLVPIHKGMTYTVHHKGPGSINCSVTITEEFN